MRRLDGGVTADLHGSGLGSAPAITGILESALYVENLKTSAAFFSGVLGLETMFESERLVALNAGGAGVLLLFKRKASVADMPTAGGTVPGHDGAGPAHMAFAIPAGAYDAWLSRLAGHGVAVRSEVLWPQGGRSVYFDDPDGHVIELATPGLWPNY
jgi:catechol 2,3-dioxygenase-like lactoylglutathione lyase family enzyme